MTIVILPAKSRIYKFNAFFIRREIPVAPPGFELVALDSEEFEVRRKLRWWQFWKGQDDG